MMPALNEVYKTNGVPTYTFVPPTEYLRLENNLRTPGRPLVIEGPSGIGKTTAIDRAIADVGLTNKTTKLSARRREDVEYIAELPNLREIGVVIIDDFHKLPAENQSQIADLVKVLADNESPTDKVIVIGINDSGTSLIRFAADLVNRIDIIPFENNPDEKIEQLIRNGERALNIEITTRDEIVKAASGSFYLAQMLCSEICMAAEVTATMDELTSLRVSFERVRSEVLERLDRRFLEPCKTFCKGNRFRPSGRAPYLHLLHWLAQSGAWVLSIPDAQRANPSMRGSIKEVVSKGHLRELIEGDEDLRKLIHYDAGPQKLVVEDPQFIFYIQNLPWKTFASSLGYRDASLERRYDFALSFAGNDRDIAELLFNRLSEEHYEVFYDRNEQSRILAEDLESYLRPIYQSEAAFVICLMGEEYPNRIWTRFEQGVFKDRVKDGSVIPVLVDDVNPDAFSSIQAIGYHRLRRGPTLNVQIAEFIEVVTEKLNEQRAPTGQ